MTATDGLGILLLVFLDTHRTKAHSHSRAFQHHIFLSGLSRKWKSVAIQMPWSQQRAGLRICKSKSVGLLTSMVCYI